MIEQGEHKFIYTAKRRGFVPWCIITDNCALNMFYIPPKLRALEVLSSAMCVCRTFLIQPDLVSIHFTTQGVLYKSLVSVP